jgi:glycosyltransferase involved in cell wall biosynthesis
VSGRSVLEQAPRRPDDGGADRIRVLHLIKGLGRGGAEQLLVNAVQHGDQSRFDYRVAYLLPWKDAFVPDLVALGVPVECLDGARGVGWIGRLNRMIKERQIDLVHVHSPYVGGLFRPTVGRARPVLVATEHNVWERYHRATYWANAVTFPRNDHVFAVSDEVRNSVRYPKGLRFLHTPPLETLHHGIDVERVVATPPPTGIRDDLGIAPEALVVGTVANFKPHKGYEYLLRVAARVHHLRPDTRFVLVGHGPLQDEMRREAKRLGVGEAVVFAGFREDALRVVRSFDVFMVSSVHEGLPLALLEAMALGRPPVATRVGGVTAVISDGVNGFVVEPRDVATQGDRIMDLLSDPALRHRVGIAASERAAAFDVRHAVRRIEQVYSGLVA